MAFHVYPDEPGNNRDHPLSVPAGASTGLKSIGPLSGSGTAFIRIAWLPAGVDPSISLKADTGDETPVPLDAMTHTVFNQPGNGGADAGDALLEPPVAGVYRLRIFLQTAATWQINIKNNDVTPHAVTWVVADSDGESLQPWINMAPTAAFNVFAGQSDTVAVQIKNLGTGPMTVTAGPAPGPGFEITAGSTIQPNGSGDLSVKYTGAAAPGQAVQTYDATAATTGDTTATPGSTQHNNRVTLTAVTRLIEAIFLVDASGSMAYTPDGGHATLQDQARWSKLKAGANQAFALLNGFANGKGKAGLVAFPNITTGTIPAPSPSSIVLTPTADISDAVASAAHTALDAHAPVENGGATPMGHGIGTAIGSVPGNFGMFQSAPDAVAFNERFLILQSDGANNSPASGPPQPTDFYPPGSSAGTSFADKKIKVIALGYGKPGTPFEVDNTLLGNLAANSSGSFLNVFADNDGMAMRKQFRQAIKDGLHLDPTQDPRGVLTAAHPEARYEIGVLPFDTKVAFVVDWADRDTPIHVSLVTPLCEVITEQSAPGTPGIFFKADPVYRMFVVNDAFLKNAAAARPRYGTWTLIVTFTPIIIERQSFSLPFEYEVITESSLRLALQFDRPRYGTGTPIAISAALKVDGRPIPGASVTLQTNVPGQSSDNWIARTAVSKALIDRARDALAKEDVTAIGIKSFALGLKGEKFADISATQTIQMTDTDDTGVYRATIDGTSVPGNYDFYVTAVGITPGGVAFRREQRASVRVDVRPDPKFTFVDIAYFRDPSGLITAGIRVFPRDQFGNVVLFDPAFSGLLAVHAKGAEASGPMVFNGDGSYTVSLQYPSTADPVISVQFDGTDLLPQVPLNPVGRLTYMDTVLHFALGHEAKPGINTHRDPKAALGDVTAKRPDMFVSLGGHGRIVLGIAGHEIERQGLDDLTVFVAPDETLRPYLVEMTHDHTPDRDDWQTIGTSPGVTQSFSLGKHHEARFIRITDLSGRIRDNEQNPLETPGVSIIGVGAKKIER